MLNVVQRKCPRGIHNGRCQGPNPAALIRLLPQSGELGISHKVRMETISFPLNRLAETWKTVSLSSNGKRHCLQANSGREPSPSTASMKRTCNSLKADFHWKMVFAMTSVFSWQNSISLCPASFCTPRPNSLLLQVFLFFLFLHSSPL